jgi:6,7-dimethyl-8-ribityllumazine synthase
MAHVIQGTLESSGLTIGVVVSRFNQFITDKLLEGALDALQSHGIADDRITVAHVPGAFEIPLITDRLAASGKYDALVCLGAVIRGDTPHFEYVCDAVTRGIGKAIWQYKLPIGFGVLTTDDVQQAMDRSKAKDANKGYEAALTAIEMVSVLRQIS